jgi:hypothetical protein
MEDARIVAQEVGAVGRGFMRAASGAEIDFSLYEA